MRVCVRIHSQSIWSFLCSAVKRTDEQWHSYKRKKRENVSDTQTTDCDDLYCLNIECFYQAVPRLMIIYYFIDFVHQ